MGDQWTGLLHGLASNEAAPADVLLRLLGHEDEWLRRAVAKRAVLPQEVIEAVLVHPDRHVRMALAENGSVDPGQRARLVDDPAPSVHLTLAHGPLAYRRRVAPLPDRAYERLLAHPRGLVGHELVVWGAPPAHILAGLAHHGHPAFRSAACRVWDRLADEARERLLHDEDPDVRQAAALQVCHEDEERTTWLAGRLGDGWPGVSEVLARGRLTRELAERVVAEGERLAAIAGNPSLPSDLVARLAVDPDPRVRLQVSARPELSESQRAAIDYTVGAEDRLSTLDWVWERREDAAFLRRCAQSAHTWLRRSAAVCPGLPADAVELLARDEDFAVRLLLAEFHPEPPPELLLDLYLNGTHRAVGMLVTRPGFPAAGLAARLGDSPDPRGRRLALRDPGLEPELLDRLSRDPETRADAGRDPRLPVARIRALLADPDRDAAAAAAANPALPAGDMRRLLDRAGVPEIPVNDRTIDC
ncbi:hypothetical protein [Streptomyces sp. NBC_01294]|uniref:hypothetical protein n=1 Tax=Streptomyces sp. NBC_01294 TaxID=2903815 RepID=UPI002DD95377|nr:hypothetical protein [Streptomyces sp. NBC_01294]WRZ55450.1 hypothetical protein OG534_02480 [Streptomyces sp. NBC_01294]WRZ61247.1 hypothetical protein OG534_35020 [Streptomyces sp. NBC_01294]